MDTMKTIDKYYELVGEYPSIEELFGFRQFLRLHPDEEVENKNYNPNRDPDGRFGTGSFGDGNEKVKTLSGLYSEYPGLEKTLDYYDEIDKSYNTAELDRLDQVFKSFSKKEHAEFEKMQTIEDNLKNQGLSREEIRRDGKYISADLRHTEAMDASSVAFNEWRDYKLSKGFKKTIAKEDLYESVYGEEWTSKYKEAHQTLRNWATNKYGLAKQQMKGDNYGALELEHALTQAHYLRNGQKEVDVYWGLYGDSAQKIISGKNKIRPSIVSVTSSESVAISYAQMDRMTSGTKRIITNKSKELPESGIVVKGKVPISRIVISNATVPDSSIFLGRNFREPISSPGAFLNDQNELIVDLPRTADVSKFDIIPTADTAVGLRDAFMQGKKWKDII